MVANPVPEYAWSYSALTQFETCPRQYHAHRVSKQVPYVQSKEAKWGERVHQQLEEFFNGAALDASLEKFMPVINNLLSRCVGEPVAERRLAINKDLEPTEYFAPDVWCRGVIDLTIPTGDTSAILIDWKTGKRISENTDQLQLFGALAMCHDPQLEKVDYAYVWLKQSRITGGSMTRADLPKVWEGYMSRLHRLDTAYAEDQWRPRPSGLCAKYCSVPKDLCKYSGRV